MWESICSLLVRKGTLSESQARYALEVHRSQPSKRFDHLLAELNLVSEPAVLETMAEVLGLRYVDLASSEIDPEAIRVVPAKLVYRYNLFPVARYNGTITIATDDPWNTAALDEVRVRTGLKVEPVLAESSGIEQQIKRHFGVGGETVGQLVTEQLGGPSAAGDALDDDAADDLVEEASVVRLVNEILTEAIRERAIRQMIMDPAHSAEIQTAAVRADMMTLRVSGTRKVLEGITTLEEVARVTKADEAPARTRPITTPGLGHEVKSHASQMFRLVDQ